MDSTTGVLASIFKSLGKIARLLPRWLWARLRGTLRPKPSRPIRKTLREISQLLAANGYFLGQPLVALPEPLYGSARHVGAADGRNVTTWDDLGDGPRLISDASSFIVDYRPPRASRAQVRRFFEEHRDELADWSVGRIKRTLGEPFIDWNLGDDDGLDIWMLPGVGVAELYSRAGECAYLVVDGVERWSRLPPDAAMRQRHARALAAARASERAPRESARERRRVLESNAHFMGRRFDELPQALRWAATRWPIGGGRSRQVWPDGPGYAWVECDADGVIVDFVAHRAPPDVVRRFFDEHRSLAGWTMSRIEREIGCADDYVDYDRGLGCHRWKLPRGRCIEVWTRSGHCEDLVVDGVTRWRLADAEPDVAADGVVAGGTPVPAGEAPGGAPDRNRTCI